MFGYPGLDAGASNPQFPGDIAVPVDKITKVRASDKPFMTCALRKAVMSVRISMPMFAEISNVLIL